MNDQIKENKNLPVEPSVNYAGITQGYRAALQVVDDVILKNYISELSQMDVVPLNEEVIKTNIRDNVLFFKITEMVYEKEEFATYKFASVFNSLSVAESAVFIIIDSDGIKTDFYMGIRSLDEDRTTSSLKNTVENAMRGQFPGIKTEDYTIAEMEEILSHIKSNSISAVSCVANDKEEKNHSNQSFVQGLEKLVISMQGEKYTGIIIANGTTQAQLRELRKGYENVYTQLSAFASSQVNYTSNNSFNYSVSESQGASTSTSHTITNSETEGYSKTKGTSNTHSVSSENVAGKTIKGVATAASMVGAAFAPFTGGMSLAVGGVVSGGLGMLGSAISKTVSDSTSTNESVTDNFSVTRSTSDGTTDTVNYGISNTEGYTKGLSEGVSLTLHDKTIENMLERIDKQLKRIDEFESLGMYECAAYFLSDDQYAAEVAASTYKALMRGTNSGVEIAAINSWGRYQKDKTEMISTYVKNLIHPVFCYSGAAGTIEVTPCSLVSGNELAIHMGLPRRSVCGLPVIEHADFGKEVVTYDGKTQKAGLNLGKVFNMGSISNNRIVLDINSLQMHTFITGSTGSGKSNTIYEMLRQLNNFNIKSLIIEPAKGEYKNVFGNLSDYQVLGTNPDYAPLLRINPFKFDKGIHVLEHVDRLVEIFNVCWPMYAAMPAVLKEAVLQAYEVCGWDLTNSVNTVDEELFPTFQDLLAELVDVIENSAYDNEVKSNYKGSLETRVRSLTNGLNGQIFSPNEIDNQELFESNVIVDLSRIGSLETKSLIMGILVMRLNEYRMTHSEGMNLPLKHVTVLEEAHNILKRTSTEQDMEGSNMTGKSVEMLSNAIAEMRTYGEGFIIADQSPSAVDISAIRNTNTKIIMRLPDEADRRLAGKSAALKEEQLDEIAKLPKGVAVVYQNDWVEPVLCKIKKFDGQGKPFIYEKGEELPLKGNDKWFKSELIKLLIKGRVNENIEIDVKELKEELPIAELSTKNKIGLYRMLNEYELTGKLKVWEDQNFEALSAQVVELMECQNKVERLITSAHSFEELNREFDRLIHRQVQDASNEISLTLSQCFMKDYSVRSEENLEIYAAWRETVKKRGGLL